MDQLRKITDIKDIYIINLKHREDRKKDTKKELKKINVKNYDSPCYIWHDNGTV